MIAVIVSGPAPKRPNMGVIRQAGSAIKPPSNSPVRPIAAGVYCRTCNSRDFLLFLFFIVPAEIFLCGESQLYFVVMQTVFWFITVVEFWTFKLGSFCFVCCFFTAIRSLLCICLQHAPHCFCLCFDFFVHLIDETL